MKIFLVLMLFIVTSSYGFDRIVDADNGAQVVVMRGHDGMNGSSGTCFGSDDDSDNGDDGRDGEDAGIVLIKYSRIENIKDIKIVSRPGDGGRGGSGCNGGFSGSSGSRGEHATVYLFNKANGEFKFSDNKLIVTPTTTKLVKHFSLNKYVTKSGVRDLLASSSNPRSTYYEFVERKEKEVEVHNNISVNFKSFLVQFDFDTKTPIVSAHNDFVEVSYENSVLSLNRLITKNELAPKNFDVMEDEKLLLSFDNPVRNSNIKFEQVFTLDLVESHWAFGYTTVKTIKVDKSRVSNSAGKTTIDLTGLELNTNRRFLKKRYMVLATKISDEFNSAYIRQSTDIKIDRDW